MKRWTSASCSASVVRMKKSLVQSSRSTICLKWTTLRSASSRGRDALALGDLRDRLAVLVGAR